jgi:hypothetical protein
MMKGLWVTGAFTANHTFKTQTWGMMIQSHR